MRFISTILPAFFLVLASPAAAQTVADQAERAYRVFAGGYSQPDFLGGRLAESLFEGATGKWARLSGPNGKTGVETYGPDRDRICSTGQAITIAIEGRFGASILSVAPSGNFTQHYTLVAGSTFAEHTDADEYLAAIGLGPDKTGANFDQRRALALVLVNGLVQIYRPSSDVIVITRDRGYPVLLARCDR
ncbi:MAG TPA: hypothetical protein VG757_03480 [Devosia sp.]|nr:hypothetical protein [Devosia sp.]